MRKYPFTLEYDPTLDRGIESVFKKGYDLNRGFFKIDLRKFKIKIWYDRKRFNKALNFPSASRFHAHSGMRPNEPMNVMSPVILRKEDPAFNYNFFRGLVIHEMNHRFLYQKWGKVIYPLWINEGIACLLEKQEKYLNKSKKLIPISKIHSYRDWLRNNNYWQAYSMTKFLIKKYGAGRLDGLFSALKEKESYPAFSKKFRKIYGITPEGFEKEWRSSL